VTSGCPPLLLPIPSHGHTSAVSPTSDGRKGGGSCSGQNCPAFKAPTTLVHFALHVKVNEQGIGLRVAMWYGHRTWIRTCEFDDHMSVMSRVLIPPAAAVYQRQFTPGSVNEYQRKLGSKRHTTRCTNPIGYLWLVSWLRLVSS